MEILFHNESFPDSLEKVDIYNFSDSLNNLYIVHCELYRIVNQGQCYVTTVHCKNKGALILNNLFAEQRKLTGKISIEIIRAIVRMLDKDIKDVPNEKFSVVVSTNQVIITNGYIDELSTDVLHINDTCLKNISNIEQFETNKFYLPIRIYESNPKHEISQLGNLKGKGVVSIMELEKGDAQIVLNKAIPDGQKLYGYNDGKFYEFQCHKDNCWHGYCAHDGIPENIQRRLTDSGR